MARRVQTEQVYKGRKGDGDAQHFDLNDLSDDEDIYGAEDAGQAANPAQNNGDGAAEDLINYKGIYFNDDAGQKFTDPETGAHFEFKDMCKRLNKVSQKR